jgi:hypothetical protein
MHSKLRFALMVSATLAAPMAVDGNALARSPKAVPHVPDLGAAIMSANVNQNGNLYGGAGAVGATRKANGLYFVAFDRSVQGCAYAGAVSGAPALSVPGFVFTEGGYDTFDGATYYGVKVTTANPGGLAGDRPFHVIVFCAK